jgi:hypothetical protein
MGVALRKLLEKDGDAFASWVANLQRGGERWRDRLPPLERNGHKISKLSRKFLAMRLADYRRRPKERGKQIKRNVYLDRVAARKSLNISRGPYHYSEFILTRSKAQSALEAAEKLMKADPSFEAEVAALELPNRVFD